MAIKRFEANTDREMEAIQQQTNPNASDTDWVQQDDEVRVDIQDTLTADQVDASLYKIAGRIREYLESSGNMP